MSFKRNQLEGALRALFSGSAGSAPQRMEHPHTVDMRIRIKRLLDVDRARAEKHPARVAASGLAFYDKLPGGRGHDASYSAQRAFNLAIALHLVDFGFKPSAVVEQIATLQPQLQQAYTRAQILRMTGNDPSGTGVSQVGPSIFLIVRPEHARPDEGASCERGDEASGEAIESAIRFGWDALRKLLESGHDALASGLFLLELGAIARQLDELLEQQPAALRGRSSGFTDQ